MACPTNTSINSLEKSEQKQLTRRIHAFTTAYLNKDLTTIASLIDANKKESIYLELSRRFSTPGASALFDGPKRICITNLSPRSDYVAVALGFVDYKDRAKPREQIFFYISERGNIFMFTELMFKRVDIFELNEAEPIGLIS